MRREGDPEGYPEVATDPETGRHFHLNSLGDPVWHEGVAPGLDASALPEPPPAPPKPAAANETQTMERTARGRARRPTAPEE